MEDSGVLGEGDMQDGGQMVTKSPPKYKKGGDLNDKKRP
ncbi:MAG: hypothetical protein PWQ70_1447 [Clostridiales bacterium]|jgi:hypothetical protein|nr:hypothetical protein [Clostridiales bacterium]